MIYEVTTTGQADADLRGIYEFIECIEIILERTGMAGREAFHTIHNYIDTEQFSYCFFKYFVGVICLYFLKHLIK